MVAPHRAHGRLRLVGGHLTGGDRAAAAATGTAVAAEIPAGLAIDLAGRVALVTGATGQLGRTMVRTLARAGADMAVHYRGNRAKAESLCEEVRQMGGRAVAVFAEVDSEESVNAMRDAIVDALGTSPGIVVANAVEQYTWTSVLEQGVDDYESQYRTCVLQNVLLAKAFCPQMIEQRWGRMIAISSVCAMECEPGQSAYDSGKRGMDGVLRVLAKEVGKHQITVNTVAPGMMLSADPDDATDPSMSYNQRSGDGTTPRLFVDGDGRGEELPLGRLGYDTDIAHAVAFLASELACFITGVYLPVSGGRVMPTI